MLDSHDRLTVYHHKDGLVCRKTGPTGEERCWKYSVHRRLLRETDAAGGATRYRYDRWGNCTDMSGPDGGSVSAAFFRKGGLRNRPVSVTTADGAPGRSPTTRRET